MPASYWVEALSTAVFLINRRPSSSIHNGIPYHLLYRKMPDYSILRVFGCLCYPNLSAMTPHKLSPRSTACVFLGYPPSQKGYRCFDLSTRKIITSRHVVFDETHFPFVASKPRPDSFDFLLQDILPAPSSDAQTTHAPVAPASHASDDERRRSRRGGPCHPVARCRLQTAPGATAACTSSRRCTTAGSASSCCCSRRSRATAFGHPLQSSTPSGTSSPAADDDTSGPGTGSCTATGSASGSRAGPSTAASISGRRAFYAGDTFQHRLSSTAHAAVWLLDDDLQLGFSASRQHSRHARRCPLAHSYGRRVQGPGSGDPCVR
jgi:hypothetical protein